MSIGSARPISRPLPAGPATHHHEGGEDVWRFSGIDRSEYASRGMSAWQQLSVLAVTVARLSTSRKISPQLPNGPHSQPFPGHAGIVLVHNSPAEGAVFREQGRLSRGRFPHIFHIPVGRQSRKSEKIVAWPRPNAAVFPATQKWPKNVVQHGWSGWASEPLASQRMQNDRIITTSVWLPSCES